MIVYELGSSDILEPEVFAELLDLESEVEKLELTEALLNRAREVGVLKQFKERLKAYKKDDKAANKVCYMKNYAIDLERNKEGKVMNTTNNYLTILREDKYFKGKMKLNELAESPEKITSDGVRLWSDVDDSKARCYIEKEYGIFSEKKLFDAMAIVFNENAYNPAKDIVESVMWDGISRIETIIIKWLKCDDTPYNREVSRLMFAGGINRLYNNGCKFDDMPVLIGRQGNGKSTFVRLLALKDDFFREVKEIEGQKGVEILQGAWVCEMGELLALTKTKEVEAVKSYIACAVDTYRKPYERRLTKSPRKCIFIGTTNTDQFLTDKTGNRRFYPVNVYCDGREIYDNMDEIRSDILQAWAEALHLYKQGKLQCVANKELRDVIAEQQAGALEDDYRVGMIEGFLDGKNRTCIIELYQEALGELGKPSPREQKDITLIMCGLGEWENTKKTSRFAKYGPQKTWIKKPSW